MEKPSADVTTTDNRPRPEDFQLKPLGGGWYRLPNNEKVKGKDAAVDRLCAFVGTTYPQFDVKLDGNGGLNLAMRPEHMPPLYPALNQTRRKKAAILGFTDHRDKAPFGDPEFEIWGINELWRYMDVAKHGFTRWFEIHDRKAIDIDKEHIKALSEFPIPVYMQRHYEDILPSVPYPREVVERNCGEFADDIWPDGRCKYFTSSIAWMLGLALVDGQRWRLNLR